MMMLDKLGPPLSKPGLSALASATADLGPRSPQPGAPFAVSALRVLPPSLSDRPDYSFVSLCIYSMTTFHFENFKCICSLTHPCSHLISVYFYFIISCHFGMGIPLSLWGSETLISTPASDCSVYSHSILRKSCSPCRFWGHASYRNRSQPHVLGFQVAGLS